MAQQPSKTSKPPGALTLGAKSICARAGCEHLSFECHACDQRFCEGHGLNFAGYRLCITCAAEGLALGEPVCECRQTDVDLFDTCGCGLHDSNSPWNVRLQAVTAAQAYGQIKGEDHRLV
jgi:hypothetical protein